MKFGIFSLNLSFFKPVADALTKRGHQLLYYKDTGNQREDGFQMGRLLQWADAYFIDFCQTPLPEVLQRNNAFKKPVFSRLHRIEVYNKLTSDKNFPWDQVDVLFASAPHVLDKFMHKRSGKSKPKEVVIAKTNTVDTNKFMWTERRWKPPFRLCMLGNFVPKKRQYTLIEMMFDVNLMHPNKFKLDIVGHKGLWSGYGNAEYYENCLDLIEDRKLEDVVTIYDPLPHDKVPEFLQDEHVIISNSNEEGTHVSIAEGLCSGCLAFVHNWRGSQAVYPPEIAFHFNSAGEFVDNCERVVELSELGQITGEAKKRSDLAIEKYGDLGIYERMVMVMEEKINSSKVKVDERRKEDTKNNATAKEESKSE